MPTEAFRLSRRAALRGLTFGSAACALGLPASADGARRLRRADPAAVGVDPAAVIAFVDAVQQKVGGLHSLMLLRHGQVAAEGWWAPYAREHPHMLYSLSKSFTSTAVGLAASEGLLTVDDRVTSFFPEHLPGKLDANLRAMRVRHLLSMSTGHEKDATGPTTAAPDGNWVKAFLALPVEREPGSLFVYNSAATYMLSAIVHKLTGKTVLDYLTPRLFEPLGIRGATWETDPRGINTGGWGLAVKTEDIARFGQLYLQRGKWEGRQLVPESWVAAATSKQIANGSNPNSDWNQGYGYQFWRCRNGAFRGDGAFGQYCVVMPEQDAVLAITSGLGDMQAVLTAAWDHLLPAMKPSPSSGRSAGDLKRKLDSLAIAPPTGQSVPATAARVTGKTYRFDSNDRKLDSLTLRFDGAKCTAVMKDDRGERTITSGGDRWIEGRAPLSDGPVLPAREAKIAARGAWTADDTYTMKLCFVETPYIQTTTYRFDGDQVTVATAMNVSFGPTARPPLTGRS